jgi:hypothetical protein
VTTRRHVERGLRLDTSQQHHAQPVLYGGHDPGVYSCSYRAQLLWLLGYPDKAEQWNEAELAQELTHPFTLGQVLGKQPDCIGSSAISIRRTSGSPPRCA